MNSSTLETEVKTVKDRLEHHGSLYEKSEMAVREQLIPPILRALGWNPEDPNEVQPGVSVDEGLPDYTLVKDGKPVLFIEAKKASASVESAEAVRQLAKYSFSKGTEYGLLTNGRSWVLVRSFQKDTALAERIMWRARIDSEDIAALSRKLATVSKQTIDRISDLLKKTQVLDSAWQSLKGNAEAMAEALLPALRSRVNQASPEHTFSDDEIREGLRGLLSMHPERKGEGQVGPAAVEPPGAGKMRLHGRVMSYRFAYEILVKTADWLVSVHKLRPEDCPVGFKGKRYLVAQKKQHSDGKSFLSPQRLSNGLWIETHHSKPITVDYAQRLLEKFGYDRDTLVVDE